MGLKPMQKDEAEARDRLPSNPAIELNDLAIDRINAERKAKGLPPLQRPSATPEASPAPEPADPIRANR